MINSIDSLLNIGRFQGFSWNAGVPAFSKVNLIFGDNGSGKTTLSNVLRLFGKCGDSDEVFRDLSSGDTPRVTVSIDRNSVTYERGVPKQGLYAFNADFVAEHVFDGSTLNCLQFDSAVVTNEQLANPRVKEIESRLASLASARVENERARNQLQERFEAIKRRLSDDLNARIRGTRAPTMGIPEAAPDATAEECARLLAAAYDEYIRAERQAQLGDDRAAVEALSLSPLATSIDELSAVLTRSVPALARERVQSKIDAYSGVQLRQGNVRDWFDSGSQLLMHVRHGGGQTCPLCDADLSARLETVVAEYEVYFSREFADLMHAISRAVSTIDEDLQRLEVNEKSSLTLVCIETRNAALFGGGQETDRKAANEAAQPGGGGRDTSVRATLMRLRTALEAKKENVVVRGGQDVQVGDAEALAAYNLWVDRQIARQQLTTERLAPSERSSADVIRDIRSLLVKLAHAEFDSAGEGGRVNEFQQLAGASRALDAQLQELQEQRNSALARLRDESRYVNGYLRALGIEHFDLIMQDAGSGGGISISFRGGTSRSRLRHSLSESEKTALALSYFLSKVRYEVVDNPKARIEDTVVVIDDPASSLDENRLHTTAQLIWREFHRCSQLFVFSHNLLFMRFVSGLIGNPTVESADGKRTPCRRDYYMPRFQSTLLELPKELANYRTTYFRRLQEVVGYVTGEISYETAKLFVPNYIRTTLETFLSFKFVVLKQGSSADKHRCAGLDKLAAVLQGKTHAFAALPAVGEISAGTLGDTLERIRRITDQQAHGSPLDIDQVSFVSEAELRRCASDALDVIRFLDPIHSAEVLMAGPGD